MKFQVIVRTTAEQKLSCKHTQKNECVRFHQRSWVAKHIANVPSSLFTGEASSLLTVGLHSGLKIFSKPCRKQTLHLPCLVPLTETDRGALVCSKGPGSFRMTNDH